MGDSEKDKKNKSKCERKIDDEKQRNVFGFTSFGAAAVSM